jgi:predicted site-specific integrase-resolvase
MISSITAYIVAIYVRLSKEDDRGDESVSIENQKSLLVQYVESQPGWTLHEVYVDDGWSGVNFQRPGFMRMLEDAKNGVVNLILVKDEYVKQKTKNILPWTNPYSTRYGSRMILRKQWARIILAHCFHKTSK